MVRYNFLASTSLYVVAALDAVRFGWSQVDVRLVYLGLLIAIVGYLIPFWAMTNNPFASGIVRIQTERGHYVVSDGPYRFVRHPMYVGSLFYGIGIPLFLGSYWALIPGLLTIALSSIAPHARIVRYSKNCLAMWNTRKKCATA